MSNIWDILKNGEHLHLECIEGKKKLPGALWETYSAFANTDSGTILIGIKENLDQKESDKKFNIEGIENPEKLLSDFWNTINSNKVNQNLLVDENVSIIEIEGKKIIRIDVPKATYKNRPIFINENLYKGTFKRNYEGNYHASPEEIDAMIRDQKPSGNDGKVLKNFTLDDLDLESVETYRNEFNHFNPGHTWNKLNDEDFLTKIGAYQLDRETGKYYLTEAGLLMFGKSEAI